MLSLSSISSFPYVQQAAGEICNRIVAIVNQEILTQKELQVMKDSLRTEMPADLLSDPNFDPTHIEKGALWAMIDERLQLQEAQKMGISVYPEEIDQNLRDIRIKNGLSSDQEMEKAIESQHMTLESLRDKIKKRSLLMKLRERAIHSKVQVTDTEISEYFAVQESKGKAESIRLSHILFTLPEGADEATVARVRDEAQRVREEVLKGKEFALAASQYSQDPDSAREGGDMGYLALDQLSLPFRKEITQLQPGQISQPVQTSFGFHLIQITDRRTNRLAKDSEQWNEIKETLISQKLQKIYRQWLEELRKQAYIEVK
ncbi:MAG: peptidyl-prolyl cis-trans isomerase SurA [Euryarchaeota archaeon]|nr:peptidyl-prolyl cis-trans isomerase SurA [Euryarchaeota archaeon]